VDLLVASSRLIWAADSAAARQWHEACRVASGVAHCCYAPRMGSRTMLSWSTHCRPAPWLPRWPPGARPAARHAQPAPFLSWLSTSLMPAGTIHNTGDTIKEVSLVALLWSQLRCARLCRLPVVFAPPPCAPRAPASARPSFDRRWRSQRMLSAHLAVETAASRAPASLRRPADHHDATTARGHVMDALAQDRTRMLRL